MSESESEAEYSSSSSETSEQSLVWQPLFRSPAAKRRQIPTVVYVHGVAGSQYATWQANTHSPLPEMVREYLYKNTSSKEYGFSTEVNYLYDVKKLLTNASIDGKSSLEYFALELLEEIWTWRDHELFDPLVIVAHDVGSIIVKKAMLLARNYTRYRHIVVDVQRLIQFGTPQTHDTLQWEKTLLNLSHAMKEVQLSDMLILSPWKVIASQFATVTKHFRSFFKDCTCFSVYQDASSDPVSAYEIIVDRETATLNIPPEFTIARRQSHFDLCRFSPEDDQLKRIRSLILDVIRKKDFDHYRDRYLTLLSQLTPSHGPSNLLSASQPSEVSFKWIFTDEVFQSWLHNEGASMLHIHGGQGAGKTSISHFLANHFVENEAVKGAAVAAFFFPYNHKYDNGPDDLCRSLTSQLLLADRNVFRHLFDLHAHSMTRTGRSQKPYITMPSAWYLLRTILSCHSQAQIFCIVDAIDDSQGEVLAILTALIELTKVSTKPFKLIITSTTGDVKLGGALSKIPFQICLDERPAMQEEARKNINAAVEDLTQKRRALRLFSGDIAQRICEPQPLNVLDASLKIRYLEATEIQSTPSSVKSVLDRISQDAPAAIFNTKNEENPLDITDSAMHRWATRVLSWMSYAFRPLQLGELATGLAMLNWMSPDPADDHLSRDIEADLRYVLGAVVIIQNDTVNFAHTDIQNAVQDWVERRRSPKDLECVCHRTIARICLAYLSQPRLRKAVTVTQSLRYEPMTQLNNHTNYWKDFGLVSYAAQYWPDHFRKREIIEEKDMKQVRDFLDATEMRDDWLLIDQMVAQRIMGPQLEASLLDTCAIAARLNLPRVVKSILDDEDAAEDTRRDVKLGDICIHASAGNCLPVLRYVFNQKSAQVSASDIKNALFEALRNGALDAVDFLMQVVEKHVNFGAHDGWLYQAAATIGGVRLLSRLLKPTLVSSSDMIEVIRAATWVNDQAALDFIFNVAVQSSGPNGGGQDPRGAEHTTDVSEFHAIAIYEAALCGHSKIVQNVAELIRIPRVYEAHGRNALHIASMLGYAAMIPHLLKSIDVNSTDNRDRSPLHLAAAYGSTQIIDLLCKAGADCNARDANGETPLFLAVREKQHDSVQKLLSNARVERNVVNKHKQYILHVAISTRSLVLVTMLVDSTTELERCDGTRMTPLHYATSLELSDIALFLVDKGVNLETEDGEGATVLLCSASRRMTRLMEHLLLKNANAMATDTFGLTGLHRAAQKGFVKGIDILLNSQPDLVDTRDPRDRTALHYAADEGNRDCIERLLSHKASLNITDDYNQRPINYAAELRKFQGAFVMLQSCPREPIEAHILQRLFHNAAIYGDAEAAKLFVERCENKTEVVNSTDDVSESGIFNAVWGGSMEITKFVLEQGANINLTANHERGVLQRAVHKNRKDLARLLLEHDALVNHSSPSEGTALHVAVRLGLLDLVKFLVIEYQADVNALDWEMMAPLQTGVTDINIVRILHDRGADLKPAQGLSSVLNKAVQEFVPESSPAVLEYLFNHGASVKDPDPCGLTATHFAARFGRLDLVRDFVDKDPAALQRRDKQGRTPLHLAAAGNHSQIVVFILNKLGLESLGNVDLADNNGWNPLHWSCKGWFAEVWEVLLQRGIDHQQTTNNGWTAQDIAAYHTFEHEFEEKIKEHPQLENYDVPFSEVDYTKRKIWSIHEDRTTEVNKLENALDTTSRPKKLAIPNQNDGNVLTQKKTDKQLKDTDTDESDQSDSDDDTEEDESDLAPDEVEEPDTETHENQSGANKVAQAYHRSSMRRVLTDAESSDSEDIESMSQMPPEVVESKNPLTDSEESSTPEAETVLSPETGLPLGAATVQGQKCTACFCVICGPLFKCKTCKKVYYCFKCAWSRHKTHLEHQFEITASEEENPSPTPRQKDGHITKHRKPSKPRKASNARQRVR